MPDAVPVRPWPHPRREALAPPRASPPARAHAHRPDARLLPHTPSAVAGTSPATSARDRRAPCYSPAPSPRSLAASALARCLPQRTRPRRASRSSLQQPLPVVAPPTCPPPSPAAEPHELRPALSRLAPLLRQPLPRIRPPHRPR
nr:extensin-like [Aegilops tauschii subsp. strangulata]